MEDARMQVRGTSWGSSSHVSESVDPIDASFVSVVSQMRARFHR